MSTSEPDKPAKPAKTGETNSAPKLDLPQREERFLRRIAGKYGETEGKPLLKSLLIFSAMIGTAHLIEQIIPELVNGWLGIGWIGGVVAFLMVYLPALYLFRSYRKMGIFKARLLRKLALYAQLGENDTPL